jgi:hypothetical protein
MADPQIRASWPKLVLRSAKQYKDARGAAIAASVPDDLRREIREIGHLGWLDARPFMKLLDIIDGALGEAASRDFWHASFQEAIHQPLIAPLARGALAMWGDSPSALVKRTPEAWIFFTRNCGTFRVLPANEDDAIVMHFEGVAPLLRTASFLHMVEGGMRSELDYVNAVGTVETRAERFPTEGIVEFVIRWQPHT